MKRCDRSQTTQSVKLPQPRVQWSPIGSHFLHHSPYDISRDTRSTSSSLVSISFALSKQCRCRRSSSWSCGYTVGNFSLSSSQQSLWVTHRGMMAMVSTAVSQWKWNWRFTSPDEREVIGSPKQEKVSGNSSCVETIDMLSADGSGRNNH